MQKTLALLLAIFTSVLTLGAQAPAGDIPKLDVEKYTLPNGLEVILSEDHRVPLVGVDVWYHVGPAHEAPGRTGFAHLFEHMMFQGSKHIESDAHFKLLAGAGATGVNGTTDFDRTNYFETMPSNQLELALWLESDRMGYLLETVDQAKLTNQQDVVRNERRQSYENRPYGIVDEAMFQALFPKGHPYHGVVIGSHADIQAAKLDDVREFFRQYYAPNNATIAIAGDIDKAATKKLIEKYFGSLKRGPAVPPVKVETPVITSERRLVVEDRVELPRIYMAWITPPFFKEGDADADIAAASWDRGASAVSTRSWSTRSRSRRTSPRISNRRCWDRSSRSRRRHGPDVRCRSSRPRSTKRSKRCERRARPRLKSIARATCSRRRSSTGCSSSADSAAWPIS